MDITRADDLPPKKCPLLGGQISALKKRIAALPKSIVLILIVKEDPHLLIGPFFDEVGDNRGCKILEQFGSVSDRMLHRHIEFPAD